MMSSKAVLIGAVYSASFDIVELCLAYNEGRYSADISKGIATFSTPTSLDDG